ncbi:ABC transporter ATP-binding protein [Bradyrhizobium sp. CW7]|uniref:ABC transporter ATP-binding protein n=1 Tax=Bradyrhizobium sp. CW7 TaxID=2782688 RepID=UPI001FFB194C|nr:ABC transporter ATP-binding protein [Bradyrhizobium sp. CW7]
MLAVKDLHAFYGNSHILHGVDLQIGVGEVVSLLGRNGVGRSTLAKSILGLARTEGSICFNGSEIIGKKPHRIARLGVGYVPENRDIFPTLTVEQNLILGEKRGREQLFTIADVYESFPRLKERSQVRAEVLSGGEQQLLSICRSLLGNPDLIVIDEPTEGLAPMMTELVAGLLRKIVERGVSILLIEQKLTIALRISNRVYVMGHGQIVFEGTPAQFAADAEVQKTWLEV